MRYRDKSKTAASSIGSTGRKSLLTVARPSKQRLSCRWKDKFGSNFCSEVANRVELPFNVNNGICTVGKSLIHVVKCKTEWDRISISADKCEVCKAERKAIIEEINSKVFNRLYGPKEDDVRNGSHLPHGSHFLNKKPLDSNEASQLSKEHEQEVNAEDDSGHISEDNDTLVVLKPIASIKKSGSKKRNNKSTLDASSLKSNRSQAFAISVQRKNTRNALAVSPSGKRDKSGGEGLFALGSTKSSLATEDPGAWKFTYDEWEKIKEQTLTALYHVSPDIDRLFSLYIQLRRVRMSSPEMSSTCNEAQALLDSTVAQLYQTMTEPCRENLKLNKMQDTDLEPLNALIQAFHTLQQQLQQFNVYDRDGIVKRSEAKIKERIRKCIAVATRTKNKELLTDVIIVIKNHPFIRCNDLMETARRTVQGINYDNFVSKHTTRLQSKDAPRAKTGKEMERLKEELQTIVNEINNNGDVTEQQLDTKMVSGLVESLDVNLRRSSNFSSFHVHNALELYFKIVRGVIRKAFISKSDEDVNHLRRILKSHGKSLPLRYQTLELLQLVEIYQNTKGAVNKSKESKDPQAADEHLLALRDIIKQLQTLFRNSELSKVTPENISKLLDSQSKMLLETGK